jgi:hypothetical protein
MATQPPGEGAPRARERLFTTSEAVSARSEVRRPSGTRRGGGVIAGSLARVVVHLSAISPQSVGGSEGGKGIIFAFGDTAEVEHSFLKYIEDQRSWLRVQIEKEFSGFGDVHVEDIELQSDRSLEIVFLLGTAFTILRTYNAFHDEMNQAVSHTQRLVAAVAHAWLTATGSGDFMAWDIASRWTPGDAITNLHSSPEHAVTGPPFGTRGLRTVAVLLFAATYLVGLTIGLYAAFKHL